MTKYLKIKAKVIYSDFSTKLQRDIYSVKNNSFENKKKLTFLFYVRFFVFLLYLCRIKVKNKTIVIEIYNAYKRRENGGFRTFP